MPKTEILFQGIVENNFHLDAIKKISELDNISELIFCVAFARSEGIDLIFDVIEIDLSKVKFFLGVRNGITSAQALHEIVKKDVEINCIDTGSSGVLFHPKIYLAENEEKGYAIIGSANITQSGLARNIETSFLLEFDFTTEEDASVYQFLKDSIINIPVNHPDNTKRIESTREIIKMLWDGIIIDERIENKTSTTTKKRSTSTTIVKSIQSYKKEIQISPKAKSKREKQKLKRKEFSSDNWILVWDGKDLSRRDLAIPQNPNTHVTAQMNFTQGYMQDIDQRDYFRDEIFQNLNWNRNVEENRPYKEIATANFRLIIKGVDYGMHTLRLNHDTRTDTRSYEQGNAMTKVHWGDVRDIVSREELLGCRLKLYESANKDTDNSFLFDIE